MKTATKKLTVVVDGQEITRRTARTYTHVVVCKANAVADHERAVERAGWDVKNNWEYYEREAGANPQFTHTEEEFAEYRRIIAAGKDARRVESIANSDARNAKTDYNTFFAFAWCGRLDLAQKQVAKALDQKFLDVRIVQVQA